MTLKRYRSLTSEETEEVTVVAGIEVTVHQEPFMRADAAKARRVLQNLQGKNTLLKSDSVPCYTSPVIREVEVDS